MTAQRPRSVLRRDGSMVVVREDIEAGHHHGPNVSEQDSCPTCQAGIETFDTPAWVVDTIRGHLQREALQETTLLRLGPEDENRPTVVTLCGSTRFVPAFNEARVRETLAGRIVLSIELVTTQARHEDPQHVDPERKAMLDRLHMRKIDLSDEILVLDVDGYIGPSTAAEVLYASAIGRRVRYLSSEGGS